MENIETKLHAILPTKLDKGLAHVVVSTFPTPSIYALHHTKSGARFYTHQIDLLDDPSLKSFSIESHPVGLTIHNEAPLLACRDGALVSLNPAGPENIGDFTDDDVSKSGILTAKSSPDGCLLLVVSPVSVSILDADFEVIAELPCEGIAQDAQVSWRSDGDFFVVVRRLNDKASGFVADRACELVKKLDLNEDQTGCTVDWEPRAGGMIAVSHGSAVLFFERNGLRHRRSDFDTGRKITFIKWSSDARALLIFGEGVLDIWMKRNYAWYCKKRFLLPNFIDAHWDEDDSRLLRVFSSDGEVRLIRFSFVPSTSLAVDNGPILAVTHGNSVILTNVASGLIPPPMNHGVLKFDMGVESVCCVENSNIIGVLLIDGSFETAVLNAPLGKPMLSNDPLKENDLPAARKRWVLQDPAVPSPVLLPYRDPVLITQDLLAVVRQQTAWTSREIPNDDIHFFRIQENAVSGELIGKYAADGLVTSLRKCGDGSEGLTLSVSSGSLVHLSVDIETGEIATVSLKSSVAAKTAFQLWDTRSNWDSLLTLVHSEEGMLEIIDSVAEETRTITRECTSFTVLTDFLVLTTRSNLLFCVPVGETRARGQNDGDSEQDVLQGSTGTEYDLSSAVTAKGAVRPIDRGSVVVAALRDDVSIILQAPRGNLETIAPRPAVLRKVTKHVAAEEFAPAFSLCRRQRIDMNHIVDADFPSFMRNVNTFVKEIGTPEHLSVFVTLLTGEQAKVNAVCVAIVKALCAISDTTEFTSAILTGMMRQEPRDYEGALKEIKRVSFISKDDARASIDYLFVLVKNHELVYGHALGSYDLELASFVAESSQMDPATYHPELADLRKKNETQRMITVDLKLERYHKALVHLHSGGEEFYDECVSLCLEHSLYETALKLFQGEADTTKVLLDGYAKSLKTDGRFDEAAAVFQQIDDSRGACDCYRLAGRWHQAVHAASSSGIADEQKVALWASIATDLEENGRMVESAQVRANFLGEIGNALTLLVDAEEWNAAFELVARAPLLKISSGGEPIDLSSDLTADLVQSASAFLSNLEESRTKLEDRRRRLTTLRYTKQLMRDHLARKETERETDSDVFSESTASSLSNLSDVTFYSKTSATSLYSTATLTGPLSSSKLEKKALRRKQKESKKRIREGHPREEEAIVAYVRKLFPTDYTLARVERFVMALLFVKKVGQATLIVKASRKCVAESLSFPVDVLAEDKARLEPILEDWIGGLPKGMADDDLLMLEFGPSEL